MKKSKVAELVGSMNKHEANRFEKYLRSPFFNPQPELLPLFRGLYRRKNEENSLVSKELIYRKVTGKREYDDKDYRYLTSFLSSHLEKFFSICEMENSPLLQANLAIRAAEQRGCEKSLRQGIRDFDGQLPKALHSHDYYYQRFLVRDKDLTYRSQTQKRKYVPRFDRVMDELDKFYFSRKLQLACSIFNVQNVLLAEYPMLLLDEIRELLREDRFSEEPSIRIYYCILQTLVEPEKESHADRLQELIQKHAGLFQPAELRNMYLYLKNYCIKRLNLGHHEYIRKLFIIYRMMLADKSLMRQEYLSQWEFKNIVSIALRLGELKWTYHFIDKYLEYLEPEARSNARLYNLANWYLHNRDYPKTLKLLQSVVFTDLYYQLDSRAMLLKLYFETDDDEAFFSQASSFRTFLSRSRLISPYQKIIYRNFIRFASKILRAVNQTDKLNAVLDEAHRVKQVADLRWIEEKIQERLLE